MTQDDALGTPGTSRGVEDRRHVEVHDAVDRNGFRGNDAHLVEVVDGDNE